MRRYDCDDVMVAAHARVDMIDEHREYGDEGQQTCEQEKQRMNWLMVWSALTIKRESCNNNEETKHVFVTIQMHGGCVCM